MANETPRVLTFATLFPSPAAPLRAPFVRARAAALAAHCPTLVVAPVLTRLGWRSPGGSAPAFASVAESRGRFPVLHPPFRTLPLVARWADGFLLYRQSVGLLERIHREFPFDLIDAQYAFPDGAAAVLLGRHFDLPVSITVRGGDLDLLPRYRLRRRVIQQSLRKASRILAVSRYLADRAARLGAPSRRIRVVENGVDAKRFHPGDRDAARRTLRIPLDERLLLCVGHLTPEKGQHLLVQSLARMEAGGCRGLTIILIGSGGNRYRRKIERDRVRFELGNRVRVLGAMSQDELPNWYRAADLMVLPTSREGSPNVVRESLACGTPVVASRVGGVPELLGTESRGVLVPPDDVGALAASLTDALARDWDRSQIAATSPTRDWGSVGSLLSEEFRGLVDERCQKAMSDD